MIKISMRHILDHTVTCSKCLSIYKFYRNHPFNSYSRSFCSTSFLTQDRQGHHLPENDSSQENSTLMPIYDNPIQEMERRGMIQMVTSPHIHQVFKSTCPIIDSNSSHCQSKKKSSLDDFNIRNKVKVYVGFDPTATSLHVGNLISIIGLLHVYRYGHDIIGLIGGATGSIGDPSGRSTERKALSEEELGKNVDSISKQLTRLIENGVKFLERKGYCPQHEDLNSSHKGQPDKERIPSKVEAKIEKNSRIKIVNNLDWFKDMRFIDFIGDVGRLARVSTMLSRESVKTRLDSPEGISFTEFSYQLLQAYDFYQLYLYHGCQIQLGGSDQWGNIVSGIDLIKRKRVKHVTTLADISNDQTKSEDSFKENDHSASMNLPIEKNNHHHFTDPVCYGAVMPLLTNESGEKFGKSAGNAVWLDEKKVSSFEFYQFFRKTSDSQVETLLKFFTFKPLSEIKDLMGKHESNGGENKHLQAPHKVLAREVTELVHGENAAKKAEIKSMVLFEDEMNQLKYVEILEAFEDDPILIQLPKDEIVNRTIHSIFVKSLTLSSKSQVRKLFTSGGLYMNKLKIKDLNYLVEEKDLLDGKLLILRSGKSNHRIIELI